MNSDLGLAAFALACACTATAPVDGARATRAEGARTGPAAPRLPWLPGFPLGDLAPDPTRATTATLVPFRGRGAVAPIVARWVGAARARGDAVLDDVREAAVGIVVLERDGVRTRLEVEARGDGEVAGLARRVAPPSARLPGACVPIPSRSYAGRYDGYGVNGDGESMETHGEWREGPRRGPDVDGDGRPDALVPTRDESQGRCADDLHWEVYVRRGECGHLVGRVGPGGVSVDPAARPGPAGLLDLDTSRRDYGDDGPVPSIVTEARRFRFDGERYVLAGETRSGGRCHHCLSIHCTSP